MAEAFDPYRKWLGIPAQEQPPHYYRLLGLELFESDADVISNAVDGRMTQIKTFQAGKYSAFSQKILNEIAAARVCLLNPAKKEEYDRQLKEKGVGAAPVPPAPPAAIVAPPPAPAGFDEPPKIAETDFASLQSDLYVAYRKPKSKAWIIPVALSLVLAIVGAVVVVMLKKDTHVFDEPMAQTPAAEKTIAKKETTAKNGSAKKSMLPPGAKVINQTDLTEKKVEAKKPQMASSGSQTGVTALLASAETTKKKTEDPDSLKAMNDDESETKKAEKNKGEEKTSEKADDEDADKDNADEKKADKKSKKPPVPSEAEQEAAEKKIRDIFGKELNAKDTAQKRDNLQKFTAQGEDTANDPATRYVFLRMAKDIAVSMGESAESMNIVESIAKAFDFGPDVSEKTLKVETLAKVLELHRYKAMSPEQTKEFYATVKSIIDDALLTDDYDTGLRACKLGVRASSRDPQTLHEFNAKQADITQAKAKFGVIRRALDTLKDDPDNASANRVIGCWLCLLKQDWPRGLPHLAKSDSELLAGWAQKELRKPSNAKAQLALADGWWDSAEKESSATVKRSLQAHAGQWYRKALPSLAGLDRTKAERRLNDTAAGSEKTGEDVEPAAVPGTRRGVVQKGNVALASNGTQITSDKKISGPEQLFDGNTTKYDPDGHGGFAASDTPCEWTIVLSKAYQLCEMRFLLWDRDDRFFRYAISISSDGKKFTPLVDRSSGEWKSWQTISFSPRPVRVIKLRGLYCSRYPIFAVVEFEAYCNRPTGLPKSKQK